MTPLRVGELLDYYHLDALIARSGMASVFKGTDTRDGRVVAMVVGDTCGACHMTIRPQHLADVRLSDEVLACENCRRLLYVEPHAIDVAQQMNN